MTRLKAVNPAEATGKTKELFNAIESKLGMVPNMMRTMGNSSALLKGYLDLSATLASGALGKKRSTTGGTYIHYCFFYSRYRGFNNLFKLYLIVFVFSPYKYFEQNGLKFQLGKKHKE